MASTYLSRTVSSPNAKTFTISAWIKKQEIDTYQGIFNNYSDNNNRGHFYFHNSNSIAIFGYDGGVAQLYVRSNDLYRDVNGWYHMVAKVDTTQATASDRVKLYVNGTAITSFDTETYPSQNADLKIINATNTHKLGLMEYDAAPVQVFLNGLMAHYHYCDGYAYDASAFGETDATSGVWKPKTSPSVTYGANGFFLKFANAASLGTDSSGNANNFTVNGTGTQTLDTPSNVYCTMNPLLKGANVSLSNGNLTCVGSGTYVAVGSTLAVNSGKWYWEAKCNTASPHNRFNVGLMKTSVNQSVLVWPADNANGYVYANDGYIYTNGSQLLNTGTTVSVGDIVGFLLDLDNGTLKLKKNGSDVYSGNAVISSLNTGDYWYVAQGADVSNVDLNFGNGYFGTNVISSPNNDGAGEGKFAYTVPTGYYALNTKNLKTYG